MKEICIPISHFMDDEIAEVTVKIGNRQESFHYRVESFPWKSEEEEDNSSDDFIGQSLKRIYRLKQAINTYNDQWELIQIFTPSEDATHIQVLYRKKNLSTQHKNRQIS